MLTVNVTVTVTVTVTVSVTASGVCCVCEWDCEWEYECDCVTVIKSARMIVNLLTTACFTLADSSLMSARSSSLAR